MQLIQCQDVTFVKDWQRGWQCTKFDQLTKVKMPGKPTKSFYDAQFPALDALIKTPVAFACLAPLGWPGEACWYEYDKMSDYGWVPVAWKESTHCDKTFVQLYMRTLDRPDLSARGTVTKKTDVAYDDTKTGCYSDLPYLGCATVLSAMDESKQPFKIGKPQVYKPRYSVGDKSHGRVITRASVTSDDCLHLVRVARPTLLKTVADLKQAGFEKVVSLKWNQYWVRGKPGIGSEAECEY